MKLEIQDLHVRLGQQDIVRGVSLSVPAGQVVGLIGPNGSGKSTLLRSIYRVLPPTSGSIQLDSDNVWQLSSVEVAQRLAVVTQDNQSDFEFTVREVIEMGRTPHLAAFRRSRQLDHDVVQEAIDRVEVGHLMHRYIGSLSGGERQRVFVARALAQQPSVLLFDEPTNHLDIRSQLDLFELIGSLRITTLVTLHDLTLAARYCHFLYLLRGGEVVTEGPPEVVLTPEHILDVYGVRAEVRQHSLTHSLQLDFYPAVSQEAL